jgi:poly-gamma-glutamate synthesis protein (capsule biosynthesis protein)
VRRRLQIVGLPTILFALAACRKPAEPVGNTSITSAPAVVAMPSPMVEPPAAPPPPAPLRVLIGGDLIPHRPSLATPAAITAALAPLHDLFTSADVVVANYEAATGELEKRAFRLAYAAPKAWLAALPEAGIGAVSVANNHACDLNFDGIDATLEATRDANLVTLGGDAKDPWQPRVLAERGGKKVCGVAWTTLVNAEGGCSRTVRLAIAPETPAGRLKAVTALQRARRECDAVVAIIHGGIEYLPQTGSMNALANQAADAGADAVIVHHPHIASPVTVHTTKDGRTVPIFASVGNLVSNQGESWKPPMFPVLRENRRLVCVNGWTRLGVLADLSFDLSAAAPRLQWGFHLVWNENTHADDRAHEARISARLIDPKQDEEILEQLSHDSEGPLSLFSDPCWLERGSGSAEIPRCSGDLTRRHARTIRR